MVGIGDGEGQRRGAHQRHIGEVIAHTGTGSRRQLQPRAEPPQRRELVGDPLQHVSHAELTAARGHHVRAPPGDHRDDEPGTLQLLESDAIAYVKGLERLAARAKVQPPVGEYAIDIEHEQADGGGHVRRRRRASDRAR